MGERFRDNGKHSTLAAPSAFTAYTNFSITALIIGRARIGSTRLHTTARSRVDLLVETEHVAKVHKETQTIQR